MKRLIGYVKDERGVETLEWIVVGALIVAIGIAIYPGTLQTAPSHRSSFEAKNTRLQGNCRIPLNGSFSQYAESQTKGRRKACSRQFGHT